MGVIKDILRTMDYGPSPESSEHVGAWLEEHQGGFGHFINGAFTKPGDLFDVFNPATGERIARVSQGAREGHRRRGRRGAQGAAEMGGALRLRTVEASLCARAPRAEAGALSFGSGDDRQRQADPRVARHRHSAGRPPFLPSRRLGLADRQRVSGDEARRRVRADHPVEFSAADARLEDRAGARGRQHGRAEAGGIHAADRARLRRDLRRDGPAPGRRQHRHRRRGDRRRARRACGRRQDRLHRLDRGRPGDSQGDGRHGQEAFARTRGKIAVHRVRGRGSRQRGRGRGRCDLVQSGTGLLRRLAAPGRGERRRGPVRQAARPHGESASRRSARQVDRRRRDRRAGSARADPPAHARGRKGRARILSR